MEKRISAFTIFTFLLFAVSTASEESSTAAGSDVVSPILPTENTQTLHVRHIEPSIPIQRHFSDRSTRIPLRFVRRHPCLKFKKMFVNHNIRSYGNDMIVSDKVTSVDLEAIGVQVPTKWLEFKHKYAHRHHHDREDKFENKFVFDKEKKREHNYKGGFMRRVRKFLKHTFD